MDAYRDRSYDDALKKAAAPAYRRIRKDAEIPGLPTAARKLLAYIEGHLFDSDLNVGTWRRQAQVRDNSATILFRHYVGLSLQDYMATLRLETAARMLAATDLSENLIACAVGYQVYRTFERRYLVWCGRKPSQDRDPAASPQTRPGLLQRAMRGQLESEEVQALLGNVYRRHPDLRPEPEPAAAQIPRLVVDGREFERFQAEQIWKQVRTLGFEEQQRTLQTYLFRSTDLFDLLRRKSREEGRKDRQRGVDIARLALVSLDGHGEVFGQRIHDLRALGWAWLANARRLMLDFEGAEKDLKRCADVWSASRPERDLEIAAEIRFLEAALRTHQRRYKEALEQVEESIRLSELAEIAVARAQALTLRASVMGYMDRLQESASDLQLAASLIEGRNEPFLHLAVSSNLANTQMRLGDLESASASLSLAKSWCRKLENRLAWHEIQHLDGNLSELLGDATAAATSFQEALEGFLSAEEPNLAALVALDLAVLDLLHGRQRRAVELTRWSIPILQAMQLHEETLAAIELLASESAAKRIDRSVLTEVVRSLHLDPLVRVNQKTGPGRRFSRPSFLRS
jgi:AraC-like DNA-binding protein